MTLNRFRGPKSKTLQMWNLNERLIFQTITILKPTPFLW